MSKVDRNGNGRGAPLEERSYACATTLAILRFVCCQTRFQCRAASNFYVFTTRQLIGHQEACAFSRRMQRKGVGAPASAFATFARRQSAGHHDRLLCGKTGRSDGMSLAGKGWRTPARASVGRCVAAVGGAGGVGPHTGGDTRVG